MISSPEDPGLLEKSDFEERVELLQNEMEHRRKIFDRNPKYMLIAFSLPLLAAGIAGFREYSWELGYYFIPVLITGIIALSSGIFLPAFARGMAGLLISVLSIFCYYFGCFLWPSADITAVEILISMVEELSCFWHILYLSHLPLIAVLFALSRCLAVVPGNKTCRTASLILGIAGICYWILLICTAQNWNFKFKTEFILGLAIAFFSITLIVFLFIKNKNNQNKILKIMKILRISIFTIFIYLIICRLMRPVFNISFTAHHSMILITLIAVSDFMGQLIYRPWSKKAAIELSRMEQEIRNFE